MINNKKLFIILVFFLGCSNNVNNESANDTIERIHLPSFIVQGLNGVALSTSNLPFGKPVVLFYFGPYCEFSRSQMEKLIENIHSMRDVNLLLISDAPLVELKMFEKLYELEKYKNVTVTRDSSFFFMKKYDVNILPFTVVFNSRKELVKIYKGRFKIEDLQKYI
jgi:hypothetical protein